ncbi:putative pentatricopeptide repeat-containing protein, mitochondrial [Ananas comosus]|uniref:Putative pentatricopeptide repeat-containing protein, mitochondrial n=1 Tax=Ananas comosus TaxID=4615 RepID=A0A199URR1_ANACO|nr:putative pentatricopeptide repeat-containing protein, mitochondrial [Ananas comosus]
MVSFVTLIQGLADLGEFDEAVELFRRLHSEGHELNKFVFTTALKLFVIMDSPELGRHVHAGVYKLGHEKNAFVGSSLIETHVVKIGYDSEIFVANALIDVYAKCGEMEASLEIFSQLPHINEVSWNTVIVGYVQLGLGEDALKVFNQMRNAEVEGTQVTYSSTPSSLREHRDHRASQPAPRLDCQDPFNDDTVVSNSLIDTYAKSGSIADARKVFDVVKERDVISWNAMISGYAIHGLASDALSLFDEMCKTRIKANDVTFVDIRILEQQNHAKMLEDRMVPKKLPLRTTSMDYNLISTQGAEEKCFANKARAEKVIGRKELGSGIELKFSSEECMVYGLEFRSTERGKAGKIATITSLIVAAADPAYYCASKSVQKF